VLSTITWVSVVPYAVLTAAGVLLWRRSHSLATIMVAVGFAAALLGQIAGLFVSSKVDTVMRAHRDATFFLVQHHAIPHQAALAGLWAAALGLLWHASRRH
jgi:hypothetical protein